MVMVFSIPETYTKTIDSLINSINGTCFAFLSINSYTLILYHVLHYHMLCMRRIMGHPCVNGSLTRPYPVSSCHVWVQLLVSIPTVKAFVYLLFHHFSSLSICTQAKLSHEMSVVHTFVCVCFLNISLCLNCLKICLFDNFLND